MDVKNNLALKKKRELLGSINKRKMSLRKYIDNIKHQNECRLEITQITKCVFLGSLCLKPVPHLFDSPLHLEELDMRVGNNKNFETKSIPTEKEPVEPLKRGPRRRQLNTPKIKKKGEKTKTDSRNGFSSVKNEATFEIIDLPSKRTEIELEVITNPEHDFLPETTADNQEEPVTNDIETVLDVNLLSQSPSSKEVQHKFQSDNSDIKTVPDPFDFDLEEDEVERLKREPTPELILSDSDEDAIDQLMYNIMDIKVGPNVFDKDFFDIPPSDEEFEEFSNDSQENKNASSEDSSKPKKYIKRSPQCKICSQNFSSYMQLKKHKQIHNTEKPYLCLKCNENHQTLDQLLAHLRTHQGMYTRLK